MSKSTQTQASSAEHHDLSGQVARELVARLQDDQRARWEQGERTAVEAYLEQHPPLRTDAQAVLDLIYHEVCLRAERGETPQLNEYVQRFPQYRDQLRYQFEVHGALQSSHLFGSTLTQTRALPSGAEPAAPASSAPPPSIAGYEIVRELGRGGMGVVYQARQVSLKRDVIVKMIRDEVLAGPQQFTRFRTEAEAIARLRHPHIVQIHEIGQQGGRPYLVLEFMDGGSLDRKLSGSPQPSRQAAQLVETLARAIHYAHQHGIIHRDLKPANILLQNADGTLQIEKSDKGAAAQSAILNLQSAIPKIADFGLAKLLEGTPTLSESGVPLGTPSYMPPEQAQGKTKEIGPAADVYALGAILYELLTGRPPFRAETPLLTIQQVVFTEPVSPRQLQPALPRDLETICLKCLQKEPRKRYPSAEHLADDLRRFLAGEPIQARPIAVWEQGLKWVKRRPAVAAWIGVSGVAALGLLVVSLWYNQKLSVALQAATNQETETKRAQDRAEANFRAVLKSQHDLANTLHGLGRLLAQDPNRLQEAVNAYRKAVAVHQELVNDSPKPEYWHRLAGHYINLGDLLRWRTNRQQEAKEPYGEALKILDQLVADAPSNPRYQGDLGWVHEKYANVLILTPPDWPDACQHLQQALPHLQAALDQGSSDSRYRKVRRDAYRILAETRLKLREHKQAGEAAENLLRVAIDPAQDCYHAARTFARCARLATSDETLPEGKGKELVQGYSERAVALLRQAIQKGYHDAARLEKDGYLRALHARQDFIEILAELKRQEPE